LHDGTRRTATSPRESQISTEKQDRPPNLGALDLLAWNIRVLRVAQDLSQDRLAQLAGVDRTYLGRIERQAENPSIINLEKIATALGVRIARLFDDPEEQYTPPKPLKAGRKRIGSQGGGTS
jgi:DNA-binding XRE family transcriptional regulator